MHGCGQRCAAAQAVCLRPAAVSRWWWRLAGDRRVAGHGGGPRPRHPLEGLELRVLGGMRRHGRLELLLVLPDGSKRLSPAEWTSQHADGGPADGGTGHGGGGAGTVGSVADLLAASVLVSAFPPVTGRGGSRLRESRRPRRTIVQPAQLSLLPDQVPAPPPDLLARLPGSQVTAAIMALAGLIAKAGQPGVTGDE